MPLDVMLVVRAQDQTGQTLQYITTTPTFEHPDANSWTPILVSLDASPDGYWGGANNGHMNGRLVKVGILADARNPAASSGTLGFDEISVFNSPLSTLDLRTATRTLALPAATISLSARMGVNVHSITDELGFDAARSAGFSFIRTDLLWAAVEKKGAFNFSSYDHLLASLEARGMGVLWILDYGHPDHGGAQPRSAADITAYARYAGAAAAHFARHNVRYEIWNEPNLKLYLPDPKVYPKLLDQAITAMRKADPTAAVSVGGICGFDLNFLANGAMAAPARRADAVGVHPYRQTLPETLTSDLAQLRQLVNTRFRRNMPIWDTEWGYSSFGDFPEAVYGDGHGDKACRRQGVLAARYFLTVWALGLPVSVWYGLRDDGTSGEDRESNFGLIDEEGNDKPSMQAVRALTGIANQRNLIGILADAPAGVHALELGGGPGGLTVIVWCDQVGGASQVRFRAKDLQLATSLLGQEIPTTISRDKTTTVTVTEADGPICLNFYRSKEAAWTKGRTGRADAGRFPREQVF